MRQWRLIYDNPAVGARNMAVDESILQAVGLGQQLPTLRVYGWLPPCLSLGYGQRFSDVDSERCDTFGWDVVRRPTGGRAILHTDELTYSLTLPADDDLTAGSVVDSYWRISGALVRAISQLGLHTEAQSGGRSSDVGPVCFEVPSHYEITVSGRKLVGSAQVRRKGGLLQHGTLPLVGDIGRICDGLHFDDEISRQSAKARVRQQALTLSDALGYEVSWEQAAEAVINGFQDEFDVEFRDGASMLSEAEFQNVDELSMRYASAEWTQRR